MKGFRNTIFFMVLLIFIPFWKAYSQTNKLSDKYEILNTYLEQEEEAYIKIFISSKDDIIYLSKVISLDQVDDDHVFAYLNLMQFEEFEKSGYHFEILPKPGELINPKMYDGGKENYNWDAYPTYESYISIMKSFATDYPDICQVFSIGMSTEGRELKFVKISDNISNDEAEPQFLYTSTMHGDETTGYVLLLHLIDHLLTN